jgi:DNA-binding SARP family transcriptional activator/tetratricopeptide (TPR) repeat protein
VEIRLLGPVGLWVDERELEVGPPKRRAVLAVLALRLGMTTSADQIIDFVWGDVPPPQARRVVIVHISRLRGILADGGIIVRAVPSGYVLDAPFGCVDVHRFRAAVDSAKTLRSSIERSASLREALRLWRGDALSGIGDSDARRPVVEGLERLRLIALERRIDADLDAGHHAELAPELAELVTRYPTHEPFSIALMLAAHRGGNRADALNEYERLRRSLRLELGIAPGPATESVFTNILRADQEAPHPVVMSAGRIPSQLPMSIRIFEGRADRLSELDSLTSGDRVPIVVISGMGGVGKTALAVRWASSAAERFPDGQMYVDLRGFDSRRPLTSLEALTRLLVAAGVSPQQVPTELDTAGMTYRSLLADRHAIVVLDNARSAAQVRELLPGGRHNVVLVTSRDSLTGLIARDDAVAMPIGILRPVESMALLARLFAQTGLSAEPETLGRLADLCGHLPLAIRILAANLTTNSERTPQQMVSILSAGARLSVLEVHDDPASALGLVFEHSYRLLAAEDRRLFRLLGAAPCVDYTIDAAAALIDETREQAAGMLGRLVAANLIGEVSPGRFGFHDLVRELAESYSAAEDRDTDRASASDRLTCWYVGLGVITHRAITPQVELTEPTMRFAENRYPFDGSAAAMAYVTAEATNLLAVSRNASERGQDDAAWQILSSLFHTLERGGAVSAAIELDSEALAIAIRRNDLVGERRARTNLAAAYNNARRPGDAIAHLERSIELARKQGARDSEASAYCNLGVSYKAMGHQDKALAAFLTADELRPDRPNCAVLNNIGNMYCRRGSFDLAGTYLNRALALARATGSRADESLCLNNIASLEFAQGNDEAALKDLHAAWELANDIGAARIQLTTDMDLARINDRLGRPDISRMHLHRALELARHTGNTQREQEILSALAAAADQPAREE